VMRTKEYLAIVRARDGALTLTTMRFADEVRSPRKLDAASQKSHKPSRRELEVAVAVIEELSADWDPDRYEDRYRRRLKQIVDHKRKGETIKAPKPSAADQDAPDLMEALERTLAELSGGGSGKSAKRGSSQPAKRGSSKSVKRSSSKLGKRSSGKPAKQGSGKPAKRRAEPAAKQRG
jgi:DNA end-binding protein Ku